MHFKNAIHYTDMQHGSDYLNKGPSSFFGFKEGNEHINEWKIVIKISITMIKKSFQKPRVHSTKRHG